MVGVGDLNFPINNSIGAMKTGKLLLFLAAFAAIIVRTATRKTDPDLTPGSSRPDEVLAHPPREIHYNSATRLPATQAAAQDDFSITLLSSETQVQQAY